MTQQLRVKNSKLQAQTDEALKDRNSYRGDHGLLATKNIILENKLHRSASSLKAKCLELETQSDLKAKCLELEASLERLKQLKRDEDSERKALSSQASQANGELVGVNAMLMLKLEVLKLDHREELNWVR